MSLNSQKGPYKEPPLYDKEPKSIDPYVVVISVTFTLIFFIVFVWIIGYCVKMSMEKNKARREQTDTNNGLDPKTYAAHTRLKCNQLQFNFPRQSYYIKKMHLGIGNPIPS